MSVEQGKRLAARKAADEHVFDGMILGVGSGSTVVYVVERVAERVHQEQLSIQCVPSSFQARQLLFQHRLPLIELAQLAHLGRQIDVTIDGADEIDCELNLIKGGGGCALQEKIVASASKRMVVVADYRKRSQSLNTCFDFVPLEIAPMAAEYIAAVLNDRQSQLAGDLARIGITVDKATMRMAKAKAGPCVTDNGNLLVDVKFNGGLGNKVGKLERRLLRIAGVIEVGLFVGLACRAYIGEEDGSVSVMELPQASA
jgi:ribose 5-phosphate isomerase A